MAYRFKLKEPLADGVRRIAGEQLDKILVGPEPFGGRAQWVHETRRATKRARSLLRLVRSGLEPAVWREENVALREVARALSGMRDRDILLQTLDKLEPASSKVLAASIRWMRSEIEPAPSSAANIDAETSDDGAEAASAAVTAALETLAGIRARLTKLDVEGELPFVLAEGVATAQRRGRAALELLAEEDSEESLHELRKCVQTHQRQMALVTAAWPELQSVRVEAARTLARLLGEAQDFAVLASAARGLKSKPGHRDQSDRIVAACRTHHAERKAEAMPLASRLFALPPRAAGDEIGRLWTTAIEIQAVGHARRDAEEQQPPARTPRRRTA